MERQIKGDEQMSVLPCTKNVEVTLVSGYVPNWNNPHFVTSLFPKNLNLYKRIFLFLKFILEFIVFFVDRIILLAVKLCNCHLCSCTTDFRVKVEVQQ